MPTNKELQKKIKELEEENKKLNTEFTKSAGIISDLVGFIRLIGLWDIFQKTMDTKELIIDEVKEAVNNICPKCREGNCENC